MNKYTSGLMNIVLMSVFCLCGTAAQAFYKGVDLSYVNEMEDCGAYYADNGQAANPFQIMANHDANLVRVRLWHNPMARHESPSAYSGYADVVTTIQRAKEQGMRVLLDFHYSDNWTDPGEQRIPAAWASMAGDTPALASALYDYTYQVLTDLNALNLMPELVQVGNEINGNMVSAETEPLYPVNFTRQATLLNAGITAVRDAAQKSAVSPKVVLHVADPNELAGWFSSIHSAGIGDYDIIGMSYYPEWHAGSVSDVGNIVANLKAQYSKEVMVVEVGVPWTNDWQDSASNMLSSYPAGYGTPTPAEQSKFLRDLSWEVYNRGGYGVVYWEPAWVSTGCQTQWGTGSHWENATFFDFNGNLILDGGVNFLEQVYSGAPLPPTGHVGERVVFQVDMAATPYAQAFITGDFSGDGNWTIIPMVDDGQGLFTYETRLPAGDSGGYYFLSSNTWSARETVPSACATSYGTDRGYSIASGKNRFAFKWSSCESVPDPQDHSDIGNVTFRVDMTGVTHSWAYVTGEFGGTNQWQIIPMTHEGNNIYSFTTNIAEGAQGAYYFLSNNDWAARESVPAGCAVYWNVDRGFTVSSGYNTFGFAWESCAPL